MERKNFQTIIQDKKTDLYFIGNAEIKIALSNFGARLVSIKVKDINKVFKEVLYSFESHEEFINADNPYYGATIGRYANRIAVGKFTLDGESYNLQINNGKNHLHGGPAGFHNSVWDTEVIDDTSISFSYHSADGEEGYPGNVDVKVNFKVEATSLIITYEATTDKKTVINLTNHAFFNLNGKFSGDILNHDMLINADHYTPVDETLIPTGEIESVENTPFDFRKTKKIGEHIGSVHQQLKAGGGYDHNFVLSKNMAPAVSVCGDQSGIVMNISTTEPGLQFYSGNFMEGETYRNAFALETQHFPDSPNHSHFPTTELNKNEIFSSTTTYQFEARK